MDISKWTDSFHLSFSTVLIIAAVVLILLSILSFIFRRGRAMIVMGIIALIFGGGSAGIAAYTAPLIKIPQYIESYKEISSKIKETGKVDKKSEKDIEELNTNIEKSEDVLNSINGINIKEMLSKTPFKDIDIEKDFSIDITQYFKGTPLEGQDINSLLSLKMDPNEIRQAITEGKDLNTIIPPI